MDVARFAFGGCIMLVTTLVARRVRVKHRMRVRVRGVVRRTLTRWVKMRIRRRDETHEKGQRRDARQKPPDHNPPIMTTCSGLVKESANGASGHPEFGACPRVIIGFAPVATTWTLVSVEKDERMKI